MSILDFLPGVTLIIFGGAAFFLMSRYARKRYENWEVKLLANQVAIPLNLAQRVLNGESSLEDLEKEAWNIAIEQGCDFEMACQVRDGNVPIKHIAQQQINKSIPFVFKPIREKPEEFHIYEMCHEPKTYINASNASSWTYQDGQEFTHLVLAGHANSAICRQISSLIYNTYLSMGSVEDSLLVPGACFLKGVIDASKLDLKIPNPFPFQIGQKAPPLKEMTGNLQPFQQDVGLSTIYVVGNGTYQQLQDTIYNSIKKAQNGEQPVLLKTAQNNHFPRALLLPFLPLGVEHPAPLSFEFPVSLFESEDFAYLKEIHHQSLVLEMTDDALRRKQIYQEWLGNDKNAYERYGRFFDSLSEERRDAKDANGGVRITGSRDYVHAEITKPSADSKEVYISPREYYEETLPGLLREDQRWIDKMDELMVSVKNRDRSRDERLMEVNLAVLIDAFLRGWPPVFLGGSDEEESKKRYNTWCKEKRESVWRAIHKRMAANGLRLEPLMEENTIFRIELVNDRVLRFTPFHMVADQDLLVYLSPDYGLTYYINQWSRRNLIKHTLPPGRRNLDQALEYYRVGAKWLDKLGIEQRTSKAEIIGQGIKMFKMALETHPAVMQEIWNGWWARFSRDTSHEFEKFKDLMRGFQAHDEADYEISGYHLSQFIKHYPDYLPDPYILLVIQELQKRVNITHQLSERHKKIKLHTTGREDLKGKVEFIQSNQPLIQELKTDHPLRLSREDQKKLEDFIRISEEISRLQIELNQLASNIQALSQKIDSGYEAIWEAIKSEVHPHLEKAKALAPDYVEKLLEQQKFSLSDFYLLRFRPLHEILQGDEYIDIANKLYQASGNLGKKKLSVPQLKGEIEGCLKVEYLKQDELKSLKDFKEKLDKLAPENEQVSVIVREMMLRKDMDQMAQTYLQDGLNKYKQSTYLLPEFVEPVQRLTELHAKHQLRYKKSLETMFTREVPLRHFAPAGTFISLSKDRLKLTKVRFDRTRNVIVGIDNSNNEFDLAKAVNLTGEEVQHLEQELNESGFLRKRTIGMSTAEMVLNTTITPSPCSQAWSEALREMEDWLIRMIAYVGVWPIPNESPPTGEFFEKIEGQPRVDGINLNPSRIQAEFFDEIGVRSECVRIVEMKI